MIRLVKIIGQSMTPEFHEGDYLILQTAFLKPKTGQHIVYRHQEFGLIFKQIDKIENDGRFFLRSINPLGLQAERTGHCSPSRITGKVLWHIKKR